ncbi:hypothetical protein IF2G_08155 [Cordyceps javanica]|nr:hypothetical protein IF2G_08155 [Cordyceps javanica]
MVKHLELFWKRGRRNPTLDLEECFMTRGGRPPRSGPQLEVLLRFQVHGLESEKVAAPVSRCCLASWNSRNAERRPSCRQ